MGARIPHNAHNITDNFSGTKAFCTAIENKIGKKRVKRSIMTSIIKEFNLEIRKLIVEDGFEWYMFGNMGRLAVYKFKPKIKRKENGQLSLPINWPITYKLWDDKPELKNNKYVYHLNEHTEGYLCKFFWVRNRTRGFVNQNAVTFMASSRLSKSIYDAIVEKNAHENYFIFEQFNHD